MRTSTGKGWQVWPHPVIVVERCKALALTPHLPAILHAAVDYLAERCAAREPAAAVRDRNVGELFASEGLGCSRRLSPTDEWESTKRQ